MTSRPEQHHEIPRQGLPEIIQLGSDEANVTISALISHIRHLEAALEKSTVDHTTNLLKKDAYEQVVLPDLERTVREGATWTVLFGDLDNFKFINDNYGHTSGDLVLRLVGKAINESTRPYDHAVRWGGDEFCLFLKNPEMKKEVEGEVAIADIVSNRINQTLDSSLDEEHAELSMSFGSATITDARGIEEAIHEADLEALSIKRSRR